MIISVYVLNIKSTYIAATLLFATAASAGCGAIKKALSGRGSEFRIQVQTDEPNKDRVVADAVNLIQSKLNAINIRGQATKDLNNSDEIVVKVFAIDDLERIKHFLFTAYKMELRKVISPPNPQPFRTYESVETATTAASGDQEVLLYQERSGSKDQFVIVEKRHIVNGSDLRDAKATLARGSRATYSISFSLRPEGAVKFGDWSGKNIGNYLAIILDKKVTSIAYIKSQIFDSGEISGRFSKEQADEVARALRLGYLPAEMKLLSETPFGE